MTDEMTIYKLAACNWLTMLDKIYLDLISLFKLFKNNFQKCKKRKIMYN